MTLTPYGLITPATQRAADEALEQMFAYWGPSDE